MSKDDGHRVLEDGQLVFGKQPLHEGDQLGFHFASAIKSPIIHHDDQRQYLRGPLNCLTSKTSNTTPSPYLNDHPLAHKGECFVHLASIIVHSGCIDEYP